MLKNNPTILDRIEAWHNWYLDESLEKGNGCFAWYEKGKCMCWSCELTRLCKELRKNDE